MITSYYAGRVTRLFIHKVRLRLTQSCLCCVAELQVWAVKGRRDNSIWANVIHDRIPGRRGK
jgi:hypothetical protein